MLHAAHWDSRAEGYTSLMLTIWHSGVENPLFDMLAEIPRDAVRLAVDFGCGQGHMARRLADAFPDARIVGVDVSVEMLRVARRLHPGPEYAGGNMLDLSAWRGRADLATTTNSLLPETRELARRMLDEVCASIRPGGWFAGVLPSGDTIEHLMNLGIAEGIAAGKSPDDAERGVRAHYVERHGFSRESGTYADDPDGAHPQKVWWPEEIRAELAARGFDELRMAKVHYPWDACRVHGWGHFPDAERVWDWAVLARRG